MKINYNKYKIIPKIIKINEEQLHYLMGDNLTEERHYPKFLEECIYGIVDFINKKIKYFGTHNIASQRLSYITDQEFCHELLIHISINRNEDIDNYQLYGGQYYAKGFSNGGLIEPQITITCPVNQENKTNVGILLSVVTHEMTHLYDDYQRQLNGNTPLNMDITINATMSFLMQFAQGNDNDLATAIAKIGYLSIKSEQTAFTAQTVSELQKLQCDLTNFRQKLKETIAYKNYIKIKNVFIKTLNNSSEQALWLLNVMLFDNYSKANIPKFDYNTCQYSIEQYRGKLKKWADNVCHKFMVNYGSIVSYYLDELCSENVENGCKVI